MRKLLMAALSKINDNICICTTKLSNRNKMTQELTYEQVIEMEENIRLKNKAEEIYNNFMKNVKLDLSTFKDGRFRLWCDSHNAKYLEVSGDKLIYQCRFLHETYNVAVTPSAIFSALKNKYRGVEHLECDSCGHLF